MQHSNVLFENMHFDDVLQYIVHTTSYHRSYLMDTEFLCTLYKEEP